MLLLLLLLPLLVMSQPYLLFCHLLLWLSWDDKLYEDNDSNIAAHLPDIDVFPPEMQDGYISIEVNLLYQGISHSGQVKQHAKNAKGEHDGFANTKPIHCLQTYQVEFNDGEHAAYRTNIIAEHLFPQCDIHGKEY
jgi:hypothetical protein